jgi:hypothetical protein
MSLSEQDIRMNLLVAYPYMSNQVIQLIARNQDKIRFVLDSGAFTAWKAGKPLELDEYCKFLDSLPFKPWRYFTLDVIGDPEGSMRNYEIMLQRGYKPVPIFTRGEDPSALDEYYKTSDLVGIGGLVGTQKNKAFVNGIMQHVGDRRVHWLGFTNINYIKHYKPYMCDSSNYSRADRYGIMDLYCGRGQIFAPTRKTFKKYLDSARVQTWKERGFDLNELSKIENWKNSKFTRELPTWSWVEFSLDAKKHIGTHLFLAMTGDKPISVAINAFETIQKEKK